MENVSGMVKGKMKLIFAECLRELKASGYKVKARVLNAMYYNVPQSRQRLIFVGVRDDFGIEPVHPAAESKPVACRNVITPDDATNTLTPMQLQRWEQTKPGGRQPGNTWFNFTKLNPNTVAPAVCKASGNAKHCHWNIPSGLNAMGYAKLASFPPTFQFIGTYGNIKNRIGNSVPPNFMRAIAEHIRDNILEPRLSNQDTGTQ
jgi:DNA (cytosine-5)-methyltransferase 1